MHGTMPQGLLKRFEVLKKCRNKFDCLVYELLFVRALKPNLKVQSDSIRVKVFFRIFIIFAPFYVNSSRQIRFKCCNLHDIIYIFLDDGVMTTPKRRILSFVFTVTHYSWPVGHVSIIIDVDIIDYSRLVASQVT